MRFFTDVFIVRIITKNNILNYISIFIFILICSVFSPKENNDHGYFIYKYPFICLIYFGTFTQ